MNSDEQLAQDAQEGATTTLWTAETPFINPAASPRDPSPRASEAFGPRDQYLESPFVSSWGSDPQQVLGPKAEAFARFMAEVHDSEFEAAYEDVVNEVSALVAERFSQDAEDPVQREADVAAEVGDYLEPLRREAEAMLDRAGAASGERDAGAVTEGEVEALVDSAVRPGAMESPTFENFLKKLVKKVKKAAKAVKKIAKKIGKIIPLKFVFDKLKKLIKPLLEKVLRKALHRLPASVRPIAAQLAKKMLGINLGSAAARAPAPEPVDADGADDGADAADGGGADASGGNDGGDAGGDAGGSAAADVPSDAVEDADVQMAGAAIEGEAFERELEMASFAAQQAPQGVAPLLRLDRARADFARRIVSLKPGEPAEPVFESFLPAVMAAAKLGVKLIGRPKVVKFLAQHLARLMKPFIGQQNAKALATPLTSAGLKMVGLETAEADPAQVGYALASAVEGTVARLASAPPAAFKSETVLEAYASDALERAAAAALPDEVIRESSRETANRPGVWTAMPLAGGAKRYLKYSRVIDVTVTPQAAEALKTFGGITLAAMLRDRAGVKVDRPMRARLHLYEAVPGTTLSVITSLEKDVRGLGTAAQKAWGLVFPLTTQAAGALTGEPGLGVDPPARFLQNPNLINVGQRLGYLEIIGAVPLPRPPAASDPMRAPEASYSALLLDTLNGVAELRFFYSEADAAELVRLLKGKAPIAALFKALTSGRDVQLRALFGGTPTPRLRLLDGTTPVHGQIPPGVWKVLQVIGDVLATRLVDWSLDALREQLEKTLGPFGDQLARAVDEPLDGVTVIVTAKVPPLLSFIKKVLAGEKVRKAAKTLALLFGQTVDISVQIRAGNAGW